MTVAELLHKLVMNALKERRFMPAFQDRTDWRDDIKKDNITIRGFNGKNKRRSA